MSFTRLKRNQQVSSHSTHTTIVPKSPQYIPVTFTSTAGAIERLRQSQSDREKDQPLVSASTPIASIQTSKPKDSRHKVQTQQLDLPTRQARTSYDPDKVEEKVGLGYNARKQRDQQIASEQSLYTHPGDSEQQQRNTSRRRK
ncbi:MAG: hypothetical protein V4501_12925 [Pseudomonadota bacterium]